MKFKTRDIVISAMLIVLYVIGAKLSIQVFTVPFSLQTLFVLLGALIFGPRIGAVSVAVYLLMGLIGLPVFAQGSGPSYFMGPSAGFLIGFFFMAIVVGIMSDVFTNKNIIKNNFVKYTIIALVGVLVQYAVAIIYFCILLNKSPMTGIELLFVPFFPVDCVKVIIAVFITIKMRKVLRK